MTSSAGQRSGQPDCVTSTFVALRIHAETTALAWDELEHDLAPVVMGVPGVDDVHLPRRREIRMIDAGRAECDVRLVVTAPGAHAALALTDGPVRRALAQLAPDICATGVRSSLGAARR